MLRFATIILSLGLHAALLIPLIGISGGQALDAGTGDDQFLVEQGIAVEGVAKLGEAEEMIETIDIPPVQAAEVPEEVKEIEPELTNAITSTESPHEEQVTAEEPKPIEEEKPMEVPVQEQAPQVATLIEKSSGQAQEGGDTTKRLAYLGQVRKTLERSKVNPRSQHSGTVLVRFTVGPKGELLSRTIQQSSGSKILDDAAMAALDRAAPFPPLPQEIARGPLEVQVPFRFVTR
ncbi:MAG: TonB family protein [Hyphomicrobium sp.]|uniref:energy transducer TonB family protein n=1 Tax=Hyphomicrobium sp. TaxID=82 RepID=UPI001310B92D|nr:energy transducer TonB [Hyphomicrobium sp.]KAB2910629.1 MAG: TonB family protein [Hyphomicrobiaceae bacterium]MBZ0209946.1 TonB family protein [Hyphomicrobium sp.]